MSERGRSKLFGRPGELLVDEPPPRIRMPSAPAAPPRAPVDELVEDTSMNLAAADEEPSITGPLRVFVGPPSPRQIAPDAGPPLRLATPVAASQPEPLPVAVRPATPPRPVPTRPGDTLPGALMTDAAGELGDILGRRVPAPRQPSRASPSDPLRTELPVVEARSPRRPSSDDDSLRTELPSLDLFGGAPEPAATRPSPREGGVALPNASDRPRTQGIPTAAARARVARVAQPPPPTAAGYEEENTRIEEMPLQIFERQRPPRDELPHDKPRADDPRFRSSPSSTPAFSVDTRIPPRTPAVDFPDLTGVTNPGFRPASISDPLSLAPGAPGPAATSEAAPSRLAAPEKVVVPEPPAAPVKSAAPEKAPPPAKATAPKPPRPPLASRLPRLAPRQARALAGLCTVALLALVGWQWSIRNPDALARLRAARAPAAAPVAAPAPPPAVDAAEDAASGVASAQAATLPDEVVASEGADAAASAGDTPVVEPPAPSAPDGAAVQPVSASQVAPAPAPAAITPPASATNTPASTPQPPAASAGQSNGAVAAAAATDRRGGYQQPMGLLLVTCDKKATVYVDNVKKGSTADGKPIELPAGSHRVKVVAGGSTRTLSARVDADQLNLVQCGIR